MINLYTFLFYHHDYDQEWEKKKRMRKRPPRAKKPIFPILLFVLFLITHIRTAQAQMNSGNIKCFYPSARPLISELYVNSSQSIFRAKNIEEFKSKCETLKSTASNNNPVAVNNTISSNNTESGQAPDPETSKDKKAVYLSNYKQIFNFSTSSNSQLNLTVFIYDFKLVSSDVYIDFTTTSSSSSSSSRKISNTKTSHAIIHLVSRQFVTFNVFNLHTLPFRNITILLNGECNLEIKRPVSLSSKNAPFVRVLHSPAYDDVIVINEDVKSNINNNNNNNPSKFSNSIPETQNSIRTDSPIDQRTKWLSYLSQQFNGDSQLANYVEYLNMLCHVKHLSVKLTDSGSSDELFRLERPLSEFNGYNYDQSDRDYAFMRNCWVDNTVVVTGETIEYSQDHEEMEELENEPASADYFFMEEKEASSKFGFYLFEVGEPTSMLENRAEY